VKFKKGDSVLFLNEKMEGVVQSISLRGMVVVLTSDGFEFPVLPEQLVHKLTEEQMKEEKPKEIPKPKPIVVEDDFSDMLFMKEQNQKNISRPHSHRRDDVELEIDLHIERLTTNYRSLSNAQIVQIQLKHAEQIMRQAFSTGMHRVVIIHGVGNGTLKQEVRNFLKRYEGLRIEDASFKKYGNGATMVYLK
jgi:DNA-nicking Smr family endonuclease